MQYSVYVFFMKQSYYVMYKFDHNLLHICTNNVCMYVSECIGMQVPLFSYLNIILIIKYLTIQF